MSFKPTVIETNRGRSRDRCFDSFIAKWQIVYQSESPMKIGVKFARERERFSYDESRLGRI